MPEPSLAVAWKGTTPPLFERTRGGRVIKENPHRINDKIRGRSIVFKEQGELLLARFANDLAEYGKPDNVPTLEGKRMILNLSPRSGK